MTLDAAMAQSEDNLIQDIMAVSRLELMSTDQLWELYELVAAELGCKIVVERDILELRLRKLGVVHNELRRERRPYPKVCPKYRNPEDHSETWAGRGKQPRWLTKELRSGRELTDFLIR
jgi:DNA-binding protein H-NS